jgi:hypothetical protein
LKVKIEHNCSEFYDLVDNCFGTYDLVNVVEFKIKDFTKAMSIIFFAKLKNGGLEEL